MIPEAELVRSEFVIRQLDMPPSISLTKKSLLRWVALSLAWLCPSLRSASPLGHLAPGSVGRTGDVGNHRHHLDAANLVVQGRGSGAAGYLRRCHIPGRAFAQRPVG